MKVLISADMEGTAGVSHWVQVTPAEDGGARATSSVEYERARLRMTYEVNAAVEGAFEGGASGVIVTDAHGGKRNLIPDELDRRVCFVTGTDSELGMMQAIDEDGIMALFFTGYHAKAGTPGGPLAHTSTGWVHDVRVDGAQVEIDLDHQSRVDSCSYLPGVERLGLRTLAIHPANGYEFGKFWRAILAAGGQMGM